MLKGTLVRQLATTAQSIERIFPRQAVRSFLVLAALWQLVSFFTPQYIVPGFELILPRLFDLRFDFVVISVARVLMALLISFLIGVSGALLLYQVRPLEEHLMPIVKLIIAIPVISWIMFAVLWFPVVEIRIAFVLVVVCAPIFLIDILDGIKGVPKDLRDMLWSLRPSKWKFFQILILPAVTPGILTSWKVNLSLAIRVVTIAELVGAASGIGYGLAVAQQLFSVADVFAWTLALIVLLLLGMVVVDVLERRLLRWRD